MKKTFEELNAMKFDIVEHFGMQKKSEFFIMNTVAPAEYGADADYQYYEVDVKTDEDLDALKAFIKDLFGMKVYATTIKQAIKEIDAWMRWCSDHHRWNCQSDWMHLPEQYKSIRRSSLCYE